MRGCLTILVLAGLFAGGAVWFGGAPAAAFVIDGALTAAGFEARERAVTVEADPPIELATGRADAVRIRATEVEFRSGITADELDLTLGNLMIPDREFERVDGRLEGVAIEAVGGGAIGPMTVDVAGAGDAAEVTAELPAEAFVPLLRGAIGNAIGTAPGSVQLVAPDRVTFSVGGVGGNGRLLVSNAGLALRVSLPGGVLETVTIFESPAGFEIRSARVGPAGLTLGAVLDVERLLAL